MKELYVKRRPAMELPYLESETDDDDMQIIWHDNEYFVTFSYRNEYKKLCCNT